MGMPEVKKRIKLENDILWSVEKLIKSSFEVEDLLIDTKINDTTPKLEISVKFINGPMTGCWNDSHRSFSYYLDRDKFGLLSEIHNFIK